MEDPHVQEARKKIAAAHGLQLDHCELLRAFAANLTATWGGRDLETAADGMIVAVFARSYSTYCSSVQQASDGWATQAKMLNRSLFEDMVDGHWIHAYPDESKTRYEEHHTYNRMLLTDVAAKHYPELKRPEWDPDERKRLGKIFGKYGDGSWTGIRLHRRVELIEDQWRTPEVPEAGVKVLRMFRDVAHRENSQALHLSAASLNAMIEQFEPGEFLRFRMGPRADEAVSRALFGSFWIFKQTATLLIDHFELPVDADELATVVAEAVFENERGHPDDSM